MFARSAFRTAAPLRRNVRQYASQPSGGGVGALGYTAIFGAVGVIGGYYYYSRVMEDAPAKTAKGNMGSGDAEKKAFTGGEQGFLSLKLKSTEDVTHNTKRFEFALPEDDQVSGLPIASALITKFQNEGMEKPVIRPYTPVSDEHQKGSIELLIKKYQDGPMSEHIHSMKPGDTLDIKGPIVKYQMQPNIHNHIAMIAGGTGITPMWQVMRGIFQNPEDKTKVTLVFGNVTKDDMLLKEKFDDLENTYPQRFRAFYLLDKPPEDWQQGKGFITQDLLKTVLPEPKEENIKVFVCGPPGLYKAVSGEKKSPQDQGELQGYLKELGYTQDQVFKF